MCIIVGLVVSVFYNDARTRLASPSKCNTSVLYESTNLFDNTFVSETKINAACQVQPATSATVNKCRPFEIS